MEKITIKDSIIRAVVLLVLTGSVVALCAAFPNAATDPRTGMVLRLPNAKEGYAVFESEASEEELRVLPKDTEILKRQYVPRNSATKEEARERMILATLILSGSDQRSLHRPEVCLDAQGWTIGSREKVTLEVSDQTLEVMDLHLTRNDQQGDGSLKRTRAHYVYWWIGSQRSTPSTFWRSLYSVLDNMLYNRNSRWGYPSVQTMVLDNGGEGARAEAQKRAYDFIRDYAPLFQKSLGAEDPE